MIPAFLLLVLSSLLASPAGAPPSDPSWSLDAVWDDGLAEVARYEAHREVYGQTRRFETIVITVKEDLDKRLGVKADPPLAGRDLVAVLKTNIISSIPAGNYPYHYMTSIFSRRDDPQTLVKLVSSSQDWCGTTWKQVVTLDGPPRLVFHSYLDGQADGSHPLGLERGALLEDQLLTAARGWRLEPGKSYPFRLYPSVISSDARLAAWRPVSARLARRETLETEAGSIPVRRIEIREQAERESAPLMSLWIEESPRHALVGMEAADGRRLRLVDIARRDYWSRPAASDSDARSLRRE